MAKTDDARKGAEFLKALAPDNTYKTFKKLGVGSLQVRRFKNDQVRFFFRFGHDGRDYRQEIGIWDPKAVPNKKTPSENGLMTIAQAEFKAMALGQEHHALLHAGGLPAKWHAEEQQRAKQKEELELQTRQELEEQNAPSLQDLCEAYVEYLRAENRTSYKEVAKNFSTHVFRPWPELAGKPAHAITEDDVAQILKRMMHAGLKRTIGKVRAYLNAAFVQAKKASRNPLASEEFRRFKLRENPVESVTFKQPSRANKDPLKTWEMRRYWKILDATKDRTKADWLKVHLLLGAPRIEQLVRLTASNVDTVAGTLVLLDIKGLRDDPEPYKIPMIEPCLSIVKKRIAENTRSEFVFSLSGGHKPIAARTLSEWAQEVVNQAPPRLQIQGFQLRRVRSGVETLLGEAMVIGEVRAALQSHGLSGVQQKHYNAAEWNEPKREALLTLLGNLKRDEQNPLLYSKRPSAQEVDVSREEA